MNKPLGTTLFRKLERNKVLISPLGLLVLAACSGGSSSPSGFTRDGNVIKGPLKDALAFLDYDGDGVKGADEPSVATDADGRYSLSGSAGNENKSVVVLTNDSTVDASSGVVVSGLSLTAPAAAKVVSLASTLVVKAQEADTSLTVAEATAKVQASLGLTGVSDLLDFNPYAAGVDAAEAAQVEVASQQLGVVLTALAAAAESAGLSGEEAIAASLAAVTTVVAGKGAGETVDLTDTSGTGDLAVIANAVKATVAVEAAKAGSSVNSTAFDAMVDSTVSAVGNVNTKVATVTDLSAAGVSDIFSVSQVLVSQVAEAVAAEIAVPNSGASKVELTDATKVDAAAANKAPTDIDLVVGGSAVAEGGAVTISEGTGSLAIANISVTDSDNGSAGFTYALAGDDASYFSIADGVLSFNAQPDFETKSSYSVAIQATDSGGKTFVETFSISISDIDEGSYNQKFQVVTDGTADAVFKDYVSGTSVVASPVDVDLSVTDGVADFGTLSVDVTNINTGLAGGASFEDPSLDIVLAKLPVISGTKTETIKITVVDGADASRDAATERSFEISFDVVLSGSGSSFAIAPQNSASISYLGAGDENPTVATLNGITNDTLSYASSTSTLSVKMLSLINQATNIVPSTVLGSGGDFHVTISGLPLLDEDGGDVSSITGKLSISDRDHTPLLADLGAQTLTEAATVAGSTTGIAAVSGSLSAQDAEGDTISYSVSGGTLNGAGTDYSLAGTYGTLTVNQATGDYTYTLDNTKTAVDALSASDTVTEEFTVQAGDGKTTGSDTLTISITGANDAPQSVASSGTTIIENASGAVVGVLSAQDPEGDGVVFTLEAVDNHNLFTIANVGGKNTLKLKDGQSANFESTPTLLVTVKASDGTNYTNKSFTISVTNVNETPSLSQPIQGQVTEDSGAAAIGTLIASDPDRGTTLEYKIDSSSATLSGTDYVLAGLYGTLTVNKNTGNYSYDINNSNGTINALSTGESLTETFGLVVSDGVNTSAQRSLTFNINGNNDAPGTVAVSGSTVAENVAGATIGTLSATDPEGNSITYSVDSSNDGDKFEIINGTTLKLKDSVSADYEAATSYSVTVNASDSNSQSQTTLTINVVDTPIEPGEFQISTDASDNADAIFTDYIGGITTAASDIDLSKSSNVLSFGTVTIDKNNIDLAVADSSSFKAPTLSLTLDQVPTISGTETRNVTMTVTEGSDGTRDSGEREAVITFDLILSGNGTAASLKAAAGQTAVVSYKGNNSISSSSLTITNGNDDFVSFSVGQNGAPSSLTLKALELLSKVSSLDPTSILGTETTTMYVKVEGLPLADEVGAISSIEGAVVVKDLIAPTTTITRASYDANSGKLVLQGANMDELAAIGSDIKGYLSWDKLSWDIDGNSSAADTLITESSVASAIVTNAETLTITLTSDGKSTLEATANFGGAGAADTLDITGGFLRDRALNETSDGTTTTDGVIDLPAVMISELVKISTDSSGDITIKDYIGSKTASSENLTTSVSNGVLNLGSVSLDLHNVQHAAAGSSNYKAPEITLNVDQAALVSGSLNKPITISIIDGSDASRAIGSERQVDVTFTLAITGDGSSTTFSTSNGISDQAVLTYYSANTATGTTLNVPNSDVDAVSIQAGSNGLPSTITIKALNLVDKINELAPTSVLGDGGNFYITVTGLPLADEVSYISSVQGNLSIENKIPPFKVSTDTSTDATVTDYLAGTTARNDTVDLTVSNKIMDFGQIYFDLENAQLGADGSSSFKSPSVNLTLDSLPDIVGSRTESITITLTDGNDASRSSGERLATVEFDVTYTSDGSAASITSAANSKATIKYYAADSDIPTTAEVSNLAENIFSLASGSNALPSTLSIRALELIDQMSSLSPSGTLGSGGDYFMSVSGLPIGDENGSVTAVQGIVTIKDRVPPTSTVSSVEYDPGNATIVITGAKFDTIGVSNTGDIKPYLDFTKISWDINGSGSSAKTFAPSDISTAVVDTSDPAIQKITLTLTSSANTAVQTQSGFGATGGDDTFDVEQGFVKDTAGNISVTDAKADAAISYADKTAPTLASFTSSNNAGAYGETATVNVTAVMSEAVISESQMSVTLNTSGSGATGTGKTITLTADSSDATGKTLTGTYSIPANVSANPLNVDSFTFTSGGIKDVYGNAITSSTIPSSSNINDSKSITIDTAPPESTITSAAYNGDTGVITLTGTKFAGAANIGVTNGGDIKDYLDWSKLTWDINGDTTDATNNYIFEKADIDTAVATTDTTVTITLTNSKNSDLQSQTGFAAEASADTIDVAQGFIRDIALNPASTDTKANAEITYADQGAPTVTSFTSTSASQAYGVGTSQNVVNITATMSEKVLKDSTFVVTLNTTTSDTVTLTAAENGTTLVGTYTVQSGATQSSALSVSSFTAGDVKDVYGNTMESTSLPSVNINTASTIIIDSTKPTSTVTGFSYNGSTGVLTITGTNFDQINASANSDVQSYLDWTKIVWDINADNGADNVIFSEDDIASAIYTNSTTLTITLEAAKKDALFAASDFGAEGGADAIDVSAGFIRDHAMNASTDDEALTPQNSPLIYSDTAKPTVSSFSSSSTDGAYGVGKTIIITATMSEAVITSSTITATLNTSPAQTVVLSYDTTDATGKTLKGEYLVASGVSSSGNLKISSFSFAADAVKDIYGNSLTSDTVPSSGFNFSGKEITIDTEAPTANISSVSYNGSTGVITITGTDFNTLGLDNGSSILDQLNWNNIYWDIDGDSTTEEASDVGFATSDFDSAVVTNDTTLTLTLTSAKKSELYDKAGFAAAGSTDTTDSEDDIDILSGFFIDQAGNIATTANTKQFSYSDNTAPTVTKFDTASSDGSYKEGAPINITATLSEKVLSGSTFDVTLADDLGVETLTAAADGTTLTGTYTVPANVTTTGMKVSSFSQGAVTDVYGNTMTSITIPSGQNLSNNADIQIDTTIPTTTITGLSYNSATGVIRLSGTNFDTLGVSNGGSLAANIDWSKLTWDINGDGATTANVTFSTSDFSAITLVSEELFTATLSDKSTTLEGVAGFGAQGSADTASVAAGFTKDVAGNLSATDGTSSDITIAYSDTTAPTLVGITTTDTNATYGEGAPINVTATMSEAVIAGSTFNVVLNTGSSETVPLTATTTGTTLTGTYTVPSNVSTAALKVSSMTAGTVTDLFGNSMTSTTVPSSANFSGKTLAIDTAAPTTTINSAGYDGATGVITLTGTNFNTLGVANGVDVKSQVNWDKLSWDINGDGTTTSDVTFAEADITSAVVTNSTTLTITLTSSKATALAGTTGFAEAGGADTIDVVTEFVVDTAGNKSATDAKADAAITYADSTNPTITKFDTTSPDKSYKKLDTINITATASENILSGGKITVTLGTNDQVVLTAAETGTTLSGTYEVGDNDTSADLTISSYTLGSGTNVVQDIYGNDMSSTTVPSGQNLSDNAAIVIDTTIPTATVSSIQYNNTSGVITITGENFDTIGVTAGSSVLNYLDFSKVYWDIDGDSTSSGSDDVTLTSSSFSAAVYTNAQTLTLTLADKSTFEATANFAAAGSADKLDVSAGFVRDIALNASTTDAKANAAVTYSDVTAPKVTSFTSTSADGTYGKNSGVNITANMSEAVQSGSKFQVTLGTTDVVILTSEGGTTLSGTYAVGSGDSSNDLSITSFSTNYDDGSSTSYVTDLFGNKMTSTSLPVGQNLNNNENIVIDTLPIFAVDSDTGVAGDNPTLGQNDGNTQADAGDTLLFQFTEAVSNRSTVDTAISSGNAKGTTSWSSDYKSLTVTLGATETVSVTDTFEITVEDVGGNESILTYTIV